ncbi:MAG: hypothetical protein PHE24_01620 [Patescibacteria group bacterium]|nr:hypothetical protein [Patescibacteria group bacterium]
MKKILYTFCFLFFVFLLTGCAGKPVMMDQLNKQGFYPYHNEMFNFNLSLPKEFQYYQTQRMTFTDYTDIDIFVPTADTNYVEQVPGYAEPIIVRVYDKTAYDNLSADLKAQMVKVAEKGNKVYNLIFWDQPPSDWAGKWTDAMKQQLIKDFKLK